MFKLLALRLNIAIFSLESRPSSQLVVLTKTGFKESNYRQFLVFRGKRFVNRSEVVKFQTLAYFQL
jgi:hypothetical protein